MPAAPSSLIDPVIGQLLLPVAQALDGEPAACCQCWPRSRTLAGRHSSDNGPLSLPSVIVFHTAYLNASAPSVLAARV